MSDDDQPTTATGCVATVVFACAWLVMFLVVGIGAGYGSDDPLLLAYLAVVLVVAVFAWWGFSRGRPLLAAVAYAALVASALYLGSTYG